MKHKIFTFALVALLAIPNMLHAEEVVIPLMEVAQMSVLPGDNPQDGNDHMEPTPTRPTSFHATINGNNLSITKQEANIPFAQAIVVNASTGAIVLNQQFTNTLQEQIANSGIYALRIETAGGALVGQFIVQ